MPSNMDERLLKIEDKLEKLLGRAKKMDDMVHNQEMMYKSFESYKKDFEKFKGKLDSLVNDVSTMQKDLHFLQAENIALKGEMKELRASIEETVHAGMANEAHISGIASKSGEDLKALVLDIAKKISISMDETDVISVCRKGFGKGKEDFVLVKFKDSLKRDLFIAKGRKSRLKGLKDRPIFFNEPLSYYSRKLFFEARKLRNDLNYKYVWVKKGRIYARKSEKDTVVLISCMADINTLRA